MGFINGYESNIAHRDDIVCGKTASVHMQYQKIFLAHTYTRSNLPAAIFSLTLGSFCIDQRYVTRIPSLSLPQFEGNTRTTVIFLVTRGGNWKHKLLPEPVGCCTMCVLYRQYSLYYLELPVSKSSQAKLLHQNPCHTLCCLFYTS